ncbi:hypothetical protein S40285_02457 [Stachybotrys chlorohalonatus IBT 40285]|uniref:RRM domain-containing protein n=1 Tax=Stachybotrys chlorohalonatus (strain IBT 40285) TaxID=1283841 RepID=A0A084R0Q3_STAC4|nr:hypothetical protein S40285_02457 [Stachybotrys chlorohalonata IBT 40285]
MNNIDSQATHRPGSDSTTSAGSQYSDPTSPFVTSTMPGVRIPPSMSGHLPTATSQSGRGPFNPSPPPPVTLLVSRLPASTTDASLAYLANYVKDLVSLSLLPVEQGDESGLRSALLHFHSMSAAVEAQHTLHGDPVLNGAYVVQILPSRSIERLSPPSAADLSHPTQSFGDYHQSLEQLSPTSTMAQPAHGHSAGPRNANELPGLFSPQSRIGNHLVERRGVSSRSLINDFSDDEETSRLLNTSFQYADSSVAGQRRSTAPQLSEQMAGLSLSINNAPGPASLPLYASPLSAPLASAPPLNGHDAAHEFSGGNGQGFGRHRFPPVNPSDKHPPCNTLYVGNLPVNTSEEELKALFSKQRGYKKLSLKTKNNSLMCFVEFEDIGMATRTLNDLYGHCLHNSVRGGIRLSFSKNPLGVRSGQPTGSAASGYTAGHYNHYGTAANRPPPGLSLPPGLPTAFDSVPFDQTAYHGQNANPVYLNRGQNARPSAYMYQQGHDDHVNGLQPGDRSLQYRSRINSRPAGFNDRPPGFPKHPGMPNSVPPHMMGL